jgi:hypothetical protein
MGLTKDLGALPRAITVSSANNVGIGAAGPSTLLQIGTGGGAGATNSIAYLGGYSSGVSQLRYIMNHNGAANAGIGTPSAGGILFGYGLVDGTVSGEWMRINTSGNVGIGESNPQARLHVARTDSGEVSRFSAPNGYIPYILIGRPDATNEGLKLSYDSNTGNTSFETVSSHNILFKNNNTERMRITSGGNVTIGDTTTNNTGKFNYASPGVGSFNGVVELYHSTSNVNGSGFVNFYVNSSVIGSIGQSGTTGVTYNTTSDYRLKEDFKDYSGLDLVSKIKTYDYKWKSCEDRMYGVIAHELQEVVPYAVTGEKDAEQMQGVDYSKLVPILVQAIQELTARLETLENK